MKTVNKEILIKIIDKYKPLGIVKAGELCLPKDVALLFLNDLEKNGVGILGFDGWRYIDENHNAIGQDPRVDVSFNKVFLSKERNIREGVQVARKYIAERFPEEINLISFALDIPYRWKELFPNG